MINTSDSYTIGIDEVGYGAAAGPIAVAALLVKNEPIIDGVKDSKLLTPKKREMLFNSIKEQHKSSIAFVSVDIINQLNVYHATTLAMESALYSLLFSLKSVPNISILIDGRPRKNAFSKVPFSNIEYITKGDNSSYAIAAASIIAKVSRDRLMCYMDSHYTNYHFNKHKGYLTKLHKEKIIEQGISPYHRLNIKNNYQDI